MGFLDHSTNNIIVDAVLTDLGRQSLAKNDGSFQIYQFALGDDEVDYAVINQFGRTVGREKIEKNTPVIEALTAGSLGLKHKLLSVSDEFLTHLPVLELSVAGDSSGLTTFIRNQTTTRELTVTIASKIGTGIEPDMLDGEFRVELNDLFFRIQGETPDVQFTDNMAIYRFPASFSDVGNTVTTTIPIELKAFSTTVFNTYSISGGNNIRTFIKVTGVNSGLTKNIEVQIT
jgi:hypothetical protein